jgi:lysylphosphatidylglycerol synthetase-like protein (DUF2156 family)
MSGQTAYEDDWNDDGCSDGEPVKQKKTPLGLAKAKTHMLFHWIQFFGVLEAIAVSAFVMLWVLTFPAHELTNWISLAQALHFISLIIVVVLSFMIKAKASWKSPWAWALFITAILNFIGGIIAIFMKLWLPNPSTYQPGPGSDIRIVGNPTKVEWTSFVVTCIAFVVAILQLAFSALFLFTGIKKQITLMKKQKANQPSENVPVTTSNAPFYPSSSHNMNKQYWGSKGSYSSINALDNASFQNEPSSFNMRM